MLPCSVRPRLGPGLKVVEAKDCLQIHFAAVTQARQTILKHLLKFIDVTVLADEMKVEGVGSCC